jgi:hypothetical protein
VLSGGGNSLEQGVVYSHEFYHALQDQHFGLESFMSEKLDLNSDQEMARHALVEGEATYIHTLWGVRQMMGGTAPPRALIEPVIRMQANLGMDELRRMVAGSAQAAAELDDIPPFILEVMMGSYMKGAAFVFAVQEQGWPMVERLYREYPPQSTEQILHPEKWLERDAPVLLDFAGLETEPALAGWSLLETNVIGEFQWRIIFSEFGLSLRSIALAAGWDGDRYAVLERGDELLLLLATTWDSEAEATEFATGYSTLLESKYADVDLPVVVERRGADVLIVEGGERGRLDEYLELLARAGKNQ